MPKCFASDDWTLGAIENFALNCRAVDDLLRNELDSQTIAFVRIEMMQRSNDDAGASQELLLCRADAIRVEAKIGPVS